MNSRNLKARKIVKALMKFGCIIRRSTLHRVIAENPKNGKSTNVLTHRDILVVWMYHNILKQLDIDRKEFERYF